MPHCCAQSACSISSGVSVLSQISAVGDVENSSLQYAHFKMSDSSSALFGVAFMWLDLTLSINCNIVFCL